MAKHDDDLQIEKNSFSIDKLEISLQRKGYLIMIMILILGIFGLFGEGLYKQISGNNFSIKYDKTIRRQNTNIIELSIKNIPDDITKIPISFSADYLKNLYIKQIIPSPLNSRFENNQIIYEFLNSKNNHEMQITFLFEPQKAGTKTGTISDMHGQEIIIQQFIYP